MRLEKLWNIVRDGKFFPVRFIKRTDGSERIMNARVRKPVEGGTGMAYDAASKDLLTVWDIRAKGWRQIPADNILEIRAHGKRLTADLAENG